MLIYSTLANSRHHGAQVDPSISRRAHRNERLLKKLCLMFTWLEGWIAVDPVPADPVNVWLDEAIAERLMNAGINDIAALQAAMKKYRQHRYRSVSKIGPVAT